jgi:hypothetical protein
MNNPVTRTKVDELLERVISLGEETQPNEITIAGLKRDAMRELNNFPGRAHMILGVVASMEWDLDNLYAHHKNAIRILDNGIVWANYGISLARVGLLQEATEKLFKASEHEPQNLEYLRRAILHATNSGLFKKAHDAIVTFTQRGGEMGSIISIIGVTPESIPNALAILGVSETEYMQTQELVFAVLRENKIRFEFMKFSIGHDPDDSNVYVQIGVPASSEKIIDMECDLAVRLNDALCDWHADKLIFAFTPLQ